MAENFKDIESLNQENLVSLIMDMLQRLVLHNGMWFSEIKHQMGLAKTFEMYSRASQTSMEIQLKKLSKLFGFQIQNGLPKPLLAMNKEDLLKLLETLGACWLVNDGIWFQSVEFTSGMFDAKRCNDSCWAQFSPVEAWSIKKFLNMPERPGLEGLKQAIRFRLYSRLNKQSIIDDGPNAIVYQINECRVQAARKRKGLDDYPCKSSGNVEYPYFAQAIDERIATECIGCPPDDHPEEWYCAWRFTIDYI